MFGYNADPLANAYAWQNQWNSQYAKGDPNLYADRNLTWNPRTNNYEPMAVNPRGGAATQDFGYTGYSNLGGSFPYNTNPNTWASSGIDAYGDEWINLGNGFEQNLTTGDYYDSDVGYYWNDAGDIWTDE
jgi:hypothetical protein